MGYLRLDSVHSLVFCFLYLDSLCVCPRRSAVLLLLYIDVERRSVLRERHAAARMLRDLHACRLQVAAITTDAACCITLIAGLLWRSRQSSKMTTDGQAFQRTTNIFYRIIRMAVTTNFLTTSVNVAAFIGWMTDSGADIFIVPWLPHMYTLSLLYWLGSRQSIRASAAEVVRLNTINTYNGKAKPKSLVQRLDPRLSIISARSSKSHRGPISISVATETCIDVDQGGLNDEAALAVPDDDRRGTKLTIDEQSMNSQNPSRVKEIAPFIDKVA